MLLDARAKVSSLVPFIMPERLAKTGPYQQVTEMVGSGPFKFVAKAFEPGHKVVYVKNTDYVPREEPVSWASTAPEWLYVPDVMTKVAALASGEVDFMTAFAGYPQTGSSNRRSSLAARRWRATRVRRL